LPLYNNCGDGLSDDERRCVCGGVSCGCTAIRLILPCGGWLGAPLLACFVFARPAASGGKGGGIRRHLYLRQLYVFPAVKGHLCKTLRNGARRRGRCASCGHFGGCDTAHVQATTTGRRDALLKNVAWMSSSSRVVRGVGRWAWALSAADVGVCMPWLRAASWRRGQNKRHGHRLFDGAACAAAQSLWASTGDVRGRARWTALRDIAAVYAAAGALRTCTFIKRTNAWRGYSKR